MCPTLLSLLSLRFCVSLKIWALAGEYEKLSLSAWPSPVVPLGQTVTLWCHSRSPLKRFTLFKTDERRRLPELQGHYVNNFTLGPVTREHAGSWHVFWSLWSAPSEPLQIVVTGVFTKPSISAHPGPLVQVGENVTLRCHSPVVFDKFILHQESSTGHFQRHGRMLTGGHCTADFVIGPMSLASVGTYRCYSSLSSSPYEWSAPSDPVDIVITDVTLVCSSESAFDQFHLLRDGENLGCPLAGGQSPHGALQAEFPLGPGTPAHSGIYRCYGSFTHSPYFWSDSSDPLFLSVTGSTTSTCPSTMNPHTTEEAQLPQAHSSTWYIVLGLIIAFTSNTIILAALVYHWCSTQN
ncbi:PREDICTED: putative killer cell immunoglobulin-like receptor-like protein KIR3DX1, partial [Bison bison bison]|uniref:Killer cell immunoglobulin-like receptor-like protein KIR3DX1 n=1 Tax=Bison bison bison TaxID=43346 RepID=A0A6P3GYS1_BISBB